MHEMILCKLGEVVLKGLNRRSFEMKLMGNIRRRTGRFGKFRVYSKQSTIYVEPQEDTCDMDAAYAACKQIFGVISVTRAKPCEKDKDAILARDMLIYGIQKYIGSYMAALQGADAIIFTAGIGENNAHLRQRVIEGFGYMGIKLDEAKNEACTAPNVKETIISTPDSTVKVIVIPTNEEIMIARDTLELVEKA